MTDKYDDILEIESFDAFSGDDLYSLLHQILRYLKHITDADAGTIYLCDGESLKFSIFQNDSFDYEKIYRLQKPLNKLRFELKEKSGTLAVESFLRNDIINIDDIYVNRDFDFTSSKNFDQEFDYKTTSILTAPLVNYFTKERIGVIQLINKKEDETYIPFTLRDIETISLVSHLVTLSITSAKDSLEEIKKINETIDEKIALETKNMKAVQEKLKNEALTDHLTGLFNRRYFNEFSSDFYNEKEENLKYDGALIMIDIDDFKVINDTYGHAVGDEVLKNLASTLKSILRKNDICIRFGGEEFVILLPFIPDVNLLALSQKIRKSIESQELHLPNDLCLKYTISLGMTLGKEEDTNFDSILIRADQALYQAKREGKNRAILK